MTKQPKPCTTLVQEYKQYKSKKYTKAQIRKHEKIQNPNILEQYQLCQDYRSLCHIEGYDSGIYELCRDCVYNVDDKARDEMRDGDYEIIWGNVYKKVD